MSETGLPESSSTGHDRQLRIVAGRDIYFDWEGFFWDPEDWSEEVAVELARECGIISLEGPQWQVIRFMREFYFYHGRAPMNKDLKEGTGLTLMTLEGMFPQGIRLGARRLAGLPNPKACL
jgi:dissimilatory sulfite reductase related protein